MKTLWGKAYSAGEFRSLGCMPIYWGVTLGWGETKVNRCLVDFQASRQLAGETWRNWMISAVGWKFQLRWGLVVGSLISTGDLNDMLIDVYGNGFKDTTQRWLLTKSLNWIYNNKIWKWIRINQWEIYLKQQNLEVNQNKLLRDLCEPVKSGDESE